MAETARTESLYETIRRLPEGVVGEIIGGQLHTHPRPAGPHVEAATLLLADVAAAFYRGRGGPGGWRILGAPELHLRLNAEVLVPDIAGWRRERLPEVPQDQRFEAAPDWICDLLSPSTAGIDRELKMPVYAAYAVAYAWLVDPREKTVEAYRLHSGAWVLDAVFSGDQEIRAAPFAHVPIPPPWAET